ncbi:hypothetical protein LRS56_07630 [Pseudomonas poae]|nr:hypothetical protein LRS56_07630 [Pseudomonas poae]
MSTAYISEIGVRPWESILPDEDAEVVTLTLINQSFNGLWESWCEVVGQLPEGWSVVREWRSIAGVDFNSKAEEYLFRKNMFNGLNSEDVFRINESSQLYSIVKKLPSKSSLIDRAALEGSHDVMLVIERGGAETEISELWTKMTVFEKRITPDKIGDFLKSTSNALLCRFYDSETHAAAQFFYANNSENNIVLGLLKRYFVQLQVDEVSGFINGSLQC